MQRYLVTQSLLSDWLWSFKLEDGHEKLLNTLKRKREPPTTAMLDGRKFENILNAVCDGAKLEQDHEWYKPIQELASILSGSQQQVKLSREITVQNVNFVLYGILDNLKAGIIYDTKFSKTYKRHGKYLDSPQHPTYFALVPEAYEFQYLICDGKCVYKEIYRPEDVEPIEVTIGQFMNYLDRHDLVDVFRDNWKSKY